MGGLAPSPVGTFSEPSLQAAEILVDECGGTAALRLGTARALC